MKGDVQLPEEAESMLAGWPVPERSESTWDAGANKILDVVASTEIGSTDNSLLAAPMPEEAGEGEQVMKSGVESKPSQSLADLAKAAIVEKEEEANELVRAGLSLAKEDDRAPEPSVAEAQSPHAESRQSGVVDIRRAKPKTDSGSGKTIGGIIAVLGVAAAVALYVSSQQKEPGQFAAGPSAPVDPAAAGLEEPAAEPAGPEPEKALEIDQLPAETGKVARATPNARSVKKLAATPEPVAAAKPEPAPNMKAEEPPDDPEMRPAAKDEATRLQPATGELTSALGAHLGAARACVAGQSAPSSALVVFGADGRVKGVTVAGPAAGTPSASCIRSALMRARVKRFAKPSFAAPTLTIRPM